ncbi:hypothetical protein [Ruegeria marina]|uniref:Cytochrome c domain-containing protein n=1 Tax=Ruegeria marina TaxID=639004 RepID=A0A1G7DG12_9RHOB|nr:hypothetical protein [Ruegeria marina]SDE50457.1 hypothetical protein SAMN04488239_12125 [Ruegeria marina]
MLTRVLVIITAALLAALPVQADDRLVFLHAPEPLVETGLMKHILPRFTLKTRVKVELVPEAQAQIVLGTQGRALFEGAGQVWHMVVRDEAHAGTGRFADWLVSEVGRNTVTSFAPGGVALFTLTEVQEQVEPVMGFAGDAKLGLAVALAKCTRCHAVDAATRMAGIASTPSFPVLRSLPDWEARFSAFYTLNPHPAFTQVADVTPPFPIDRPSPIAPVELTLDDVEAVLAYVATMEAAQLGAPLQQN